MHDEFDSAKTCALSFIECYGVENLLIMGNVPEISSRLALELGAKHQIYPSYIDRLRVLEADQDQAQVNVRVNVISDLLLAYRRGALNFETDYIVFLHPDHRVLRPIMPCKIKSDIDYYPVNAYDSIAVSAIKDVLGHSLSIDGYGLPTFMNRSSLLECLDLLLDREPTLLSLLMNMDSRFVYDDFLLPIIFEFLGFNFSDRAIMHEMKRRRRIKHYFVRPLLLHQVRN